MKQYCRYCTEADLIQHKVGDIVYCVKLRKVLRRFKKVNRCKYFSLTLTDVLQENPKGYRPRTYKMKPIKGQMNIADFEKQEETE